MGIGSGGGILGSLTSGGMYGPPKYDAQGNVITAAGGIVVYADGTVAPGMTAVALQMFGTLDAIKRQTGAISVMNVAPISATPVYKTVVVQASQPPVVTPPAPVIPIPPKPIPPVAVKILTQDFATTDLAQVGLQSKAAIAGNTIDLTTPAGWAAAGLIPSSLVSGGQDVAGQFSVTTDADTTSIAKGIPLSLLIGGGIAVAVLIYLLVVRR